MHKLRALLPGQNSGPGSAAQQRHSVSLEPEIGFQISIEASQQQTTTTTKTSVNNSDVAFTAYQRTTVPELNVNLIAARHLPALFGFKIVQGYLIKVKMFPGSKRLDSSIQTNSWPKFNENFKFPLAPDIKPSLKHSSRRGSKSAATVAEFTPEEIFTGHFVVFTVYALLELPPASFNRLNKTYRSLRDKSTNLVQKVVESSGGIGGAKTKDDKENATNANGNQNNTKNNTKQQADNSKSRRKSGDPNPRDAIPPLTISESRRNIGSVTCYLEPKIFERNPRTGQYSTEELWLPIKDITTTVPKGPPNSLANAAKGIVEIVLELQDLSEPTEASTVNGNSNHEPVGNTGPPTSQLNGSNTTIASANSSSTAIKHPHWNRVTAEMRRKIGLSNNSKSQHTDLVLRITTARMRCATKVKDELEANAGSSVYVKTSVFEHNIYVDAWKSANFYPSLSTKWDVGGMAATLTIPLKSVDDLDHVLIRTTLATKSKMATKLRLGTVELSMQLKGSAGAEQLQQLREVGIGERVAAWHCYQ